MPLGKGLWLVRINYGKQAVRARLHLVITKAPLLSRLDKAWQTLGVCNGFHYVHISHYRFPKRV